MNYQDKYFTRIRFKLMVYENSGMEFQKFFSQIMHYADPGFKTIKPCGNWGDGGNDGYNPSSKHYYQIYAPLATTTINSRTAQSKLKEDYDKLVDKWGYIQGYSFVINDRFEGIDAPLANQFDAFISEKQIVQGEIIDSMRLQTLFISLDEDAIMDILGICYPYPTNSDFEPSQVSELIHHLLNETTFGVSLLNSEAPNFDKKIEFNKLEGFIANRLRSNSYEVYKIDEFLSLQHDEGMAQELAMIVNRFYKELKDNIPEDEEYRNELIYFGLIDKLVPSVASKKTHVYRGYSNVAEIIIAKYFETCDTYEDPNISNPS